MLRSLLPALLTLAVAEPALAKRAPVANLYELVSLADGVLLLGTEALHRAKRPAPRAWGSARVSDGGHRVAPATGRGAALDVAIPQGTGGLVVIARAPSGPCKVDVKLGKRRLGQITLGPAMRAHRLMLRKRAKRPTAGVLSFKLRRCAAAGDGTRAEVHSIRFTAEGDDAAIPAPPAPARAGRELALRPGERVSIPALLPAGASLRVGRVAGGALEIGVRTGAGEFVGAARVPAGHTARILPLVEAEGPALVELTLAAVGEVPGGWVTVADSVVEADVAPAPSGAKAAAPPKRIILHIVDSLRQDKLRAWNPDTPVKTPAMDRLADEGVTFERFSVQGCWSKPSAASLFTSTYGRVNRGHSKKRKMPRDIPMLQEVFKRAGWKTAAFLANGYAGHRTGYNRGWSEFHNFIERREVCKGRGRCVLARALLDRARQWIDANRDDNTLIVLFTVDTHLPYRPKRAFWKPYYKLKARPRINPNNTGVLADKWQKKNVMPKRKADWEFYKALYLGEIATTDHYLAELLDWLEAESLLDETLYMLTSDHGEEFKDHDSVGHGHTLYQELLHVPLLLRWPALGLAGHRVRTAVEAIDIGPTLLAAAGIEAPDRWQGASLLPLLRAPEPPMPRAAFAEMGGIATSAWLPPYKLIRYHAWGGKDLLFDLSSDPGEKENLAKRSPMAMKLMGRHLEIFEGVRGTWRKPVDGALGDPTKLLGGDPGRAASLEDERTTAGPASAGD